MDIYDYKGIKGGKYTQGEIEAVNKDEAAYKLRGQKVIITGLEKSKTKFFILKLLSRPPDLSCFSIIIFLTLNLFKK